MLYLFVIVMLMLYYGNIRVTLIESSYSLYSIIEFHSLNIIDNRYTIAFTNFIPALLSYFDFPVKMIACGLIFNYALPFIFTCFILKYKASSYRYLAVFLLSYSCFNYYIFFLPIADYWIGFYTLFIIYRLLDDDSMMLNRNVRLLSLTACSLISVISHLNLVVPLFTLLLYFAYYKKSIRMISVIPFLITAFFLSGKLFLMTTDYENQFLSKKDDFNLESILSGMDNLKFFLFTLADINIIFSVICCFVFYWLYANRKFYYLTVLLLMSFGYVMYINIFLGFSPYGYYIEGYYKFLGVLWCLVFYNLVEIKFKDKVVPVLYMLSLIQILIMGTRLDARYTSIAQLANASSKNTVYAFNYDICPRGFYLIPIESLMINLLENNKQNFFALKNNDDSEYLDVLHEILVYDNPNRKIKPDSNIVYRKMENMDMVLNTQISTELFLDKKCQTIKYNKRKNFIF